MNKNKISSLLVSIRNQNLTTVLKATVYHLSIERLSSSQKKLPSLMCSHLLDYFNSCTDVRLFA